MPSSRQLIRSISDSTPLFYLWTTISSLWKRFLDVLRLSLQQSLVKDYPHKLNFGRLEVFFSPEPNCPSVCSIALHSNLLPSTTIYFFYLFLTSNITCSSSEWEMIIWFRMLWNYKQPTVILNVCSIFFSMKINVIPGMGLRKKEIFVQQQFLTPSADWFMRLFGFNFLGTHKWCL